MRTAGAAPATAVRIADSMPPAIDRAKFIEPQFVTYKSRDGKPVPAALFVPSSTWSTPGSLSATRSRWPGCSSTSAPTPVGYLWQGCHAVDRADRLLRRKERGPDVTAAPAVGAASPACSSAGANANDGQTLYNRMLGATTAISSCSSSTGSGSGDEGIRSKERLQRRRRVDGQQMMRRQLDWAQSHGFDRRLELLARHGSVSNATPAASPGRPRVSTGPALRRPSRGGGRGGQRGASKRSLRPAPARLEIRDVEMVRALLGRRREPNLRDHDDHRQHAADLGRARASARTAEIRGS